MAMQTDLGTWVGSGVNGYLQSRRITGFWVGLLCAATLDTLRRREPVTHPLTETAHRLGVDILRGALLGGARGALRGILYGQINNLAGHALGWLLAGANGPVAVRDGVYFYAMGAPFSRRGGALALGHVVCGPIGLSRHPDSYLYRHELCHVHHPLERALGALYIPAHLLDLLIGRLGERLGYGYRWYLFEEHVQRYPYSRSPARATRTNHS